MHKSSCCTDPEQGYLVDNSAAAVRYELLAVRIDICGVLENAAAGMDGIK